MINLKVICKTSQKLKRSGKYMRSMLFLIFLEIKAIINQKLASFRNIIKSKKVKSAIISLMRSLSSKRVSSPDRAILHSHLAVSATC